MIFTGILTLFLVQRRQTSLFFTHRRASQVHHFGVVSAVLIVDKAPTNAPSMLAELKATRSATKRLLHSSFYAQGNPRGNS